MARPDDSVGFPVAQAALASHDRRPLLNAEAIGNLGAARVTAITLALFLLTAQLPVQRAPLLLVGINVAIDTFVANGGLLLQFQPTSDLLGTPLLPQQQLNQPPSLRGDPRRMRLASSTARQLLCLPRSISLGAT